MKIIVDAFGGDNAPLEIIKGCIDARSEYGVQIILAGDSALLKACASQNDLSLDGFEILEAPQTITMEDPPKMLLKEKSDCSMAVGVRALADKKGDAFVSAGSTGALVYAATFIEKRISGIKRITIGSVLPTLNDPCLLLDSGANAECHPEQLVQFAVMGDVYMKKVMNLPSPRIGLLNIGTESTKGDSLRRETYALLSDTGLNFVGNVEARDIPFGCCDVVVTDGFTGNVFLKTYEGTASMVLGSMKKLFASGAAGKLSYLLIKDGMHRLKASMSYSNYGGAPLLGSNGVIIKAHGSSDATAVKNAVRQAVNFSQSDVTGIIRSSIKSDDKEQEH